MEAQHKASKKRVNNWRLVLLSCISFVGVIVACVWYYCYKHPSAPVLTATDETTGKIIAPMIVNCARGTADAYSVDDNIVSVLSMFSEDNTLNSIGEAVLHIPVDGFSTARYTIYKIDGNVYDTGGRRQSSSLLRRLIKNREGGYITILSPFEAGEYVYTFTVSWAEDDLQATYAIKIVVTNA